MHCSISNTVIRNSQDLLYGVIVSTLTSKTIKDFTCSNNTFININRNTLQNNNNNFQNLKDYLEEMKSTRHNTSNNAIHGRFSKVNRERQVFINISQSFYNDTFENCNTIGDYSFASRMGGAIIIYESKG